jgi:hypothetical protein
MGLSMTIGRKFTLGGEEMFHDVVNIGDKEEVRKAFEDKFMIKTFVK